MTYRLEGIATLIVAVGLLPLMMFAASVPLVGSLAPEFTLTSQEGKPVSLKVNPNKHSEEVLAALAELQKQSGGAQ